MTSTEIESLTNNNKLNYDWFEQNAYEATLQQLQEKYKTNEPLLSKNDYRQVEERKRGPLIVELQESLEIVHKFVEEKKLELEDIAITEKELDKLQSVHDEIKEWLLSELEAQNKLTLMEDPVLLSKDLENKNTKLMGMYMVLRKRPKPVKLAPTPSETAEEEKEEPVKEEEELLEDDNKDEL